MILFIAILLWGTQLVWNGDGALIATLVEDGSQTGCKYDQSSLNAMCGALVFCKMYRDQKVLFCRCEKLVGPNQFSGLYNQPLSTYECSPLRKSFCLPPSIGEDVSSVESCFYINLTHIKLENGTKILETTQFKALSVKNPQFVIVEFIFQTSVSQVLNKPIESVQVMVGGKYTHAYVRALKLTAVCCLLVIFKVGYNRLSE